MKWNDKINSPVKCCVEGCGEVTRFKKIFCDHHYIVDLESKIEWARDRIFDLEKQTVTELQELVNYHYSKFKEACQQIKDQAQEHRDKVEELEHDIKVSTSFRKLYLNEKKKLSKLKQILLLTDDSVSDVEMNELTRRQWLAYIGEFPEECDSPKYNDDIAYEHQLNRKAR